jgi:AcrR family transcriptional regulator
MLSVGMSVKSRRDEHTEATRSALLEAARALFVGRGFGPTSIDDVAAKARVSKGAVYHHFRDKAELFEAIFCAEQTRLVAHVISAAAETADPWDQLLACVDAYVDGCIANADHRALLQQAVAALGANRCRAIDETIALPVLRAGLEPLIGQGLVVRLPLEMLVRVLFSALCEASMTAASSKDSRSARRDASRVLRALLGGLRPSGDEVAAAPSDQRRSSKRGKRKPS